MICSILVGHFGKCLPGFEGLGIFLSYVYLGLNTHIVFHGKQNKFKPFEVEPYRGRGVPGRGATPARDSGLPRAPCSSEAPGTRGLTPAPCLGLEPGGRERPSAPWLQVKPGCRGHSLSLAGVTPLPGSPCCFIVTGTLLLDLEMSRGQSPAPCFQPPVLSRGQPPDPGSRYHPLYLTPVRLYLIHIPPILRLFHGVIYFFGESTYENMPRNMDV